MRQHHAQGTMMSLICHLLALIMGAGIIPAYKCSFMRLLCSGVGCSRVESRGNAFMMKPDKSGAIVQLPTHDLTCAMCRRHLCLSQDVPAFNFTGYVTSPKGKASQVLRSGTQQLLRRRNVSRLSIYKVILLQKHAQTASQTRSRLIQRREPDKAD